MKQISFYLLIVCLAIWSVFVCAGNGSTIVFERTLYQFGAIPEDGESPVCVFRFKNTGSSPVAIAHVQTTCGCAVPTYSKAPVPAGGTGTISVVYNPQGRPGKFNRTVIINFSGWSEPLRLTIVGEVIPGAVRKRKNYPHVMGDLQLRTAGLHFEPMRGEEQEQSVYVINSGRLPLRILLRSTDPYLTVKANPDILLPDASGEIVIIRKAGKDKTKSKDIRILQDKEGANKEGQVAVLVTGL